MTKIYKIPAAELNRDQCAAWARRIPAQPGMDSPFFRPEFTRLVAAVREGVEVAIIEQDGVPAAFFPYQVEAGRVAWPVGGAASDFHGLVAADDFRIDAKEILRQCQLRAWHFNHLPPSQVAFHKYHWPWVEATSPYLDLSKGFEAYRISRKKAGTKEISQTLRKSRKAGREVGELRLQTHTADPQVLNTLFRWKMEQYRQWKVNNYLKPAWVRAMMERLVATQEEHFSGMLSALYIGDQLAAAHLGIRAGGVLHSWLPAYQKELYKYSPGLILLVLLAQQANSLGITRIDLGRGREEYKRRFMSGAFPLAEGSVDARPVTCTMRRCWYHAREVVRNSPLQQPARRLVRNIRAWRIYRGGAAAGSDGKA